MKMLTIIRTALAFAGALFCQDTFQFSDPSAKNRYRLADSATSEAITKAKPARGARTAAAPILINLDELPSQQRLDRMTPEERMKRLAVAARYLTEKVLVKGTPEALEPLFEATAPDKHDVSLVAGWRLVTYASPLKALDALRWLSRRPQFEHTPVLARQQSLRATDFSGERKRAVNDPLFLKQWHLTGQPLTIGLGAAWDYVTGKGINVTVVDDGLEIDHPDLRDNAYPLSSGYHRNFNSGPNQDPTPSEAKSNHGTACGGLVAARGFNGIGLSGVAPESRLMGLRLIAEAAGDDAEAAAFAWQPAGLVTHVSSNSWGPEDDGKASGRPSALTLAGMEQAATSNRDGLGTVIVISAGNGRQAGDNSSYDGYASSRFAIGVGAVNRKIEPSSFSEQGLNVAISAFGGEFKPPEVLWTTNNSGPEANQLLKTNFETTDAPVDYTDAFNGTSAAAPQVSGAAALLLELNPRLGYRDVKEILMRSATREGLSGGDEFVRNSGGFFFSHSFGAGLLNVARALALAEEWTNLGPLVSVSAVVNDANLVIPDGEVTGAIVRFDLSAQPAIRVEHVEFLVNVAHENRGDVGFLLTSPSGMQSIAEPREKDDTKDFKDFVFTSVRHWGERSTGVWTLGAIDLAKNGAVGGLVNAAIKVYGTRLN
ncbi:MAG: S8 family serine peptidase [Acidobacteria bacterium]|nr:S8 family serine peptidase [Acidobacteriota bacterium]